MYRDVMSMVKISLSWPEKLKSRKICSACCVCFNKLIHSHSSPERIGVRQHLHLCYGSILFVIPPNSNTFSDWRRTCHVSLVKTS